jgi:predicted nucleic acid-binding protein
LLDEDLVLCHPLIIGEMACGNLKNRSEVLGFLALLPGTPTIEHDELLAFIDTHTLFGKGLGWIDVHLLAAALVQEAPLWTLDQPLRQAARKLHCSYDPSR